MNNKNIYTAFAGYSQIGKGELIPIIRKCKKIFDDGCSDRIVIYEDLTGQMFDFELNGSEEEVVERLKNHPMLKDKVEEKELRSPGRPKLGVVPREISLLPRHWEWLAEQSGGASAVIRKLIDQEKKRRNSGELFKKHQAATHRFMWDIAGDMEGFEEASRLLYRADFKGLEEIIVAWPEDVFKHLASLLEKLKVLKTEADLQKKHRDD